MPNLGRLTHVTSHEDSTSDPNDTSDVANQVQITYNTQGQVSQSQQAHAGVADPNSPSVEYAYDPNASSDVYTNGLRLASVTYPQGRVIYSDYGAADGINDRLGRIYRIRETNSSGTIVTEYAYNGTSRLVETDYPVPQVRLQGFDIGSAGTNVYNGFDRFGRRVDHYWRDDGAPADVARIKYGYDYAGNRTWREDVVADANGKDHDEFYAYDGLHRLTNMQRGDLSGSFPDPNGIAGTPGREQQWGLDQLGNWATFENLTAGTPDLDQTRYHNAVNEIDGNGGNSITGTPNWADPEYDDAGNMTKLPTPYSANQSYATLTYDAWNRLVGLADPVGYAFEYDGLNRRIVKSLPFGAGSFDYYYNQAWQLVEERKTGDPDPPAQYVWHPDYIDALAVRYWDANLDGDYLDTNEGAQYYCQDANFNVTAVVESDGDVLERYGYTPYGEVTFLQPNFNPRFGNTSSIANTHLYTGRERDPETRLQLNRNRYYASHLGRWLSRDPIEYFGGTLNVYEYVSSTPTVYVDAAGLYWPGYPYAPHPIHWGTPYGEDPVQQFSAEHPTEGAIIGGGIVCVGVACVAAPIAGGGAAAAALGDGAALAGPGVAAACTKLNNIQQLINGIGFQIGQGGIQSPQGQQMIQQLQQEIGHIIGTN